MDKSDALEYLNQARVFVGQEDYDDALEYINKALEADSMNIDIYIQKGIILANLDDYNQSIAEFDKALKLDKQNAEVYFHLGNLYLLKDERAKGIEFYNKAITFGFDNSQVYYNLGLMYEEDDELDLAIRNYSKCIMADPLRSDARVRKAEIYIASQKYPEAIEVLNELILADPDLFDGYHLKAILLGEIGKYDEAMSVLKEAMNLFPKDPAFVLDKVNILVQQGDTDAAQKAIEELDNYELTLIQKRQAELEKSRLFALAEDYANIVKSLEAAKDFSKQNNEDDVDEEATFLLINCYIQMEEYSNAARLAKELIDHASLAYAIPAYYFLPFALNKKGETKVAAAQYKESVSKLRSISLSNPEILDSYLFRALCLRDMANYEKSLELCNYLLKIDEKNGTFHNLKAEVLFAMGNEEEAKKEKALADLSK